MTARVLLLLAVLLLSGCAGPGAPGTDPTPDSDLAGASPDAAAGPPSSPLGPCPERPSGLPDHRAPGEDLMEAVVRVWRHTAGDDPVAGATVAAYPVGGRPTGSFLSTFGECVLAVARSDNGGLAVLELPTSARVDLLAGFGTQWHGSVKTADVAPWIDLVLYDTSEAPRNTCNLPERPHNVPDAEAFATGLVPVRVDVFIGRAGGMPESSAKVAAVDVSDTGPWGSWDLGEHGNPCVVASARTDRTGHAILWLPADGPFRFVTEAPVGYEDQNRSVVATAPAPVVLRSTDPDQATPDGCDEPKAPTRLPDDEQFALDLVPITFRLAGSRPDRPAEIVALHPGTEAPWNTFDLRRFFTSCALAEATTPAPTATLWLKEGQSFHAVVRPNLDYIGSVQADLVAKAGLVVDLRLVPKSLSMTFEGTGGSGADARALPVDLDDLGGPAVLEHLDSAYVRIDWENAPTAWADLRVRLRSGGADLATSYGEPHPPLGSRNETLYIGFQLDDERCRIEEHGLELVVDAEGVGLGDVAYKMQAILRFEEGPPFDAPFAPEPCV